jgi:flagellar basal-body rod protein FlgB
MSMQSLFDDSIAALHRALNFGASQHRVLTSNIANIDTPNYKAFEAVMEDALQKNCSAAEPVKLVCTQPQHLAGRHSLSDQVKIKASDPPPINLRADGNTVDLEKTMGKLAENSILYRTAAQVIRKKFQWLLNSIQGGMR